MSTIHDQVRDQHPTHGATESTGLAASGTDNARHSATYKALAALRIAFGITFLWAFFDKLLALGFSTGALTNEAGVKTGDSVTLSRKGSEDVIVDRNKLDEKGQIIGKDSIDAFRNKWEVKPVELKVDRVMSDDEKLKRCSSFAAAAGPSRPVLSPRWFCVPADYPARAESALPGPAKD
jgi:hypothetical protein